MKALVATGTSVVLEERPDPRPREGEVVVDLVRAGICNTDLELAKGYMGHRGVLGHELLARHQGRRVAVEINASCRRCDDCTRGLVTHCPRRTVLGILGRDGAFAEKILVPEANLHGIPDGLDDDRAVFVEPAAAALHVLDELEPGRRDRVAVVGDGKLGLLVALSLRGTGAGVVLVGHHERQLALAARSGASVVLEEDSDRLRRSFEVVVDATGAPSGLARSLALIRPRGTLVLKSTFAAGSPVDLAPIVVDEIRVVGSRCGAFPRAIRALADGAIDPLPLVDARFPLARAEEAFARAAERGVLKVLLHP